MKTVTFFLNMLITISIFGQNISFSKDTVTFIDYWVFQESSDSIIIYNTDNNILSLDSVYSQHYMFNLMIYQNDSLVTGSFVSNQDIIPLSLEIPPYDSIKFVFSLFVPVTKVSSSLEIYTDTISIFNNSINNPNERIIALTDIALGISDKNYIPVEFELFQNYPNPFNPTTTIKFTIPKHSFVTFKIYDLLGREISTIVNENMSRGIYELDFDGSNLASGIYIYRIKAGTFNSSKKFVLMK